MSLTKTMSYGYGVAADYDLLNLEIYLSKLSISLSDLPLLDFLEDFADDTGFTYDAAKVEFAAGVMRQKSTSIVEAFLQAFTSDVGFTYDNTKAEFASGLARTKTKRPANATFGATFTNNVNGSWGNGTLTGTPNGSPSIDSGKLKLTTVGGADNVGYPAASNADILVQTGCIRFKFTPNFTSAPAADLGFFFLSQAANNSANLIQMIQQNGSGNTSVQIYNSTFTPIVNVALNFGFVSGVEVEIEINFDVTTGATRVFKNGVQVGTTQTGTGIRSSAIGAFKLGTSYDGRRSDFWINDFQIFSTVQHTANYTPSVVALPEYDYVETVVQCPAQSYNYNIAGFGSPTVTEVNAPHYVVNGYYWNGAAWAASSNTYATSMTLAQWQANIATFPGAQLGTSVTVKVIFQDSNTLSSIDNMAFDINETHYSESAVECAEMHYTGTGTLQAITNFVATVTGAVRFALQIGRSGNYLYWNGSAWATSNETYAQSNDKATFLAHVAALDIEGEVYGQFMVIFPESNSQCSIDEFTATVTGQQYESGTAQTNDGFNVSAISAFVQSAVIPAGDTLLYALYFNSKYWYWNGTAWAESDKSVGKLNTAAQINSNISALTFTENQTVYLYIYMASVDGTTTPELDSNVITYEFGGIKPTQPETCYVWGYLVGPDIEPIEGATITVEVNIKSNEYCEAAKHLIGGAATATTDANGYWIIELIRSSEFEGAGDYIFSYKKGNTWERNKLSGSKMILTVPDSDNVNVAELFEAAAA